MNVAALSAMLKKTNFWRYELCLSLLSNCLKNENKEFTTAVQEVLCQLNESNPFGALQRYFVEEYFLHGRSKREIEMDIFPWLDLLVEDLENTSIRFLRHPEQAKPLQPYIKK